MPMRDGERGGVEPGVGVAAGDAGVRPSTSAMMIATPPRETETGSEAKRMSLMRCRGLEEGQVKAGAAGRDWPRHARSRFAEFAGAASLA
jgi:hypothetical protein